MSELADLGDLPECETCGKTDCPDADLVAFSEPRDCIYAPIYHALHDAKDCEAAWDECHESGTPWDNPYPPVTPVHPDADGDYTGCGTWRGESYCDLPHGHGGPHHAHLFWQERTP